MKKIKLTDIKLEIPDTVYSPSDDTYLMIDTVLSQISDDAFEIGAGSGASILLLAINNPQNNYFASDLNFNACIGIQNNAHLNMVENIQIICGSLLTPFRRHSLPLKIYFNPPYLPADNVLDRLLSKNEVLQYVGGTKGFELSIELIGQLEKTQELFLIISSTAIYPKELQNIVKEYQVMVVDEMTLSDGEILWVVSVRRK